jgi:hypothetical protein
MAEHSIGDRRTVLASLSRRIDEAWQFVGALRELGERA